MKRERRTYSVREVLESWLQKNRKIGYRIKTGEALTLWSRINDKYVSAHTDAVSIKEGVLIVNTDSSALANELSLKEKEFKDILNRELGEGIVAKIVFRSGFVRKKQDSKGPGTKRGKKLSMETLRRVDNLVESVRQHELREVLKRLFISSAKSGRNKQ